MVLVVLFCYVLGTSFGFRSNVTNNVTQKQNSITDKTDSSGKPKAQDNIGKMVTALSCFGYFHIALNMYCELERGCKIFLHFIFK